MKIYKRTSDHGNRSTSPQVRIQFGSSKFLINSLACEKMGVTKGQGVYVGTENKRLYLVVPSSPEAPAVFVLRAAKGSLTFGCKSAISKILFEMGLAKNGQSSMRFNLGDAEACTEGVRYRLTKIG